MFISKSYDSHVGIAEVKDFQEQAMQKIGPLMPINLIPTTESEDGQTTTHTVKSIKI